jgi:long-chain fatty acid transport protein
MLKLQLSVILTLLLMMASYANPWQFQGTRTNTTGNTFNIFSGGAESAWESPASMVFSPGKLNISGGAAAIFDYTGFRMEEPSLYRGVTNNPLRFPYMAYFTFNLSERLSLGFALNSAYSRRIRWQEENWAGRFLVKEMEIATRIIQPAIAYKISPQTSLGVGIIIAHSELFFNRALPLRDQNNEGSLDIWGNTVIWGINIGVHRIINEQLVMGISFKSAMTGIFEDASVAASVPASLMQFFPEINVVDVTFKTPSSLQFILGYQQSEKLVLLGNLGYILGTKQNPVFNFKHNTQFLQDFDFERTSNGLISAGIGAEYKPAAYLQFRGGSWFYSALTGSKLVAPDDPWLTGAALTGGISFIPAAGISIDLGIVFLNGFKREVEYSPANFGGRYLSRSYLPSAGLSFTFYQGYVSQSLHNHFHSVSSSGFL